MLKDKEIVSFRVSDGNTVKLEHRSTLTSTVELAREYARAGYPDRYVIFTERQGESESGLYMSCILRPSIFPSQAGLIGPLATVAFAAALEEHTSKKLGIGWVSDIYCDGIKVGGCSVEGKLDNFTSYEYMIITFAVKIDERIFPPRLTDMVRTVFEADNTSVAMIIARTVLNKFFMIYRDLKSPEKHMDAYKAKFALAGKKIKYLSDGKKRLARVVDIDKKNCTLIIEAKDSSILRISSPSMVIIPNKL
ncbi:MAG: hypothetical protein E7676_06175 [Ruminococcaceae bacterium]|nr:hypothetical protein [Oscillospiraceae bacterium]